MNIRKWIPRVVVGGLGLFVLIQLVPYGRDHVNPKVVEEVKWPDARTKELARRACLDCGLTKRRIMPNLVQFR